mmetsp:Transcript_28519/g.63651  ORF Transcript_28519/g.63651 Transcript_28519/m.63651 type:complete len:269 (+) Transcript_28519:2232-3038(+)
MEHANVCRFRLGCGEELRHRDFPTQLDLDLCLQVPFHLERSQELAVVEADRDHEDLSPRNLLEVGLPDVWIHYLWVGVLHDDRVVLRGLLFLVDVLRLLILEAAKEEHGRADDAHHGRVPRPHPWPELALSLADPHFVAGLGTPKTPERGPEFASVRAGLVVVVDLEVFVAPVIIRRHVVVGVARNVGRGKVEFPSVGGAVAVHAYALLCETTRRASDVERPVFLVHGIVRGRAEVVDIRELEQAADNHERRHEHLRVEVHADPNTQV